MLATSSNKAMIMDASCHRSAGVGKREASRRRGVRSTVDNGDHSHGRGSVAQRLDGLLDWLEPHPARLPEIAVLVVANLAATLLRGPSHLRSYCDRVSSPPGAS
jgi:hypothetical protein